MPADIRELANSILRNPVHLHVAPVSSTTKLIEQSVYYVAKRNKSLLLKHLLQTVDMTRALVFTRTKRSADRVTKQLQLAGVRSAAIHGDKSQSNRERALEGFRAGKVPVLVATDIAARGIDVDAISHVFNYDVPNVAETYVHRIGRTGRAGATGIAISFCDHEERADFLAIQRLIRGTIKEMHDHPEYPPSSETPQHGRPGRVEGQRDAREAAAAGSQGGSNGRRSKYGTGRPHQPAGSGGRQFGPQENNRGGSGSRSRNRGRGRGRPAGSAR
jgi:ATP-dependent RNA helicase RhlE